MPRSSNIKLRDANLHDIDSLATVIPRSFPPNAFLNKLFPDSPSIREWWAEVFRRAIESPFCQILVAVDDDAIGMLTLQLWQPGESRDGLISLVPLIDAHPEQGRLQQAMRSQVERREQIQESNFMIDLMGVDRGYQGLGIGKQLVQRACQIADSQDATIYLQTTAARAFYLRLGMGFVSDDAEPGVVTRPPRKDVP